MLKAVFPEHEWNVDELKKKPHGHWKDIHVQRSFLLELGKKLNIPPGPDFEPWYKVTTKVLRENGGRGLLGVYGFSMSRILKSVFPEHPCTSCFLKPLCFIAKFFPHKVREDNNHYFSSSF